MRCVLIVPLAAALFAPAVSNAASVNYGDKVAADVIYRQVTEDSITDPVPLFGNPSTFGNSLVFTPVNFGATAQNGALDITDATLTTTIEAKPNMAIQQLIFSEAGDYSFAGAGTAATTATVTAPYFVRIVEVDNSPISPIQQNGNLNFSPSAGTYNAFNDPGSGIIWTGNATIDVAAMLANAQVPGRATKILFSIDNQLIATSEQGSISFIKKKTADGVIITIILPEPAALGLLGGGLITVLRRRRV